MGGDADNEAFSARDEVGGPSGLVDSDDTTQADAGMTGGSGADEAGASATPQATEPHADDDELNEG